MFGPSREKLLKDVVFQQDMFLGMKYDFNDPMGKSIKWVYIRDTGGKNEKIYQVSYNQRLREDISASIGGRRYHAPKEDEFDKSVGLQRYHDDNSIFFNAALHF